MKTTSLLLRPRWREGESWDGYLLRVANANEMPGIWSLARLLGIQVGELLVHRPAQILEALGFRLDSVPQMRTCEERRQASRGGHGSTGRSRRSVLPHGRQWEAAYCPLCLASDEVPHFRAIWSRPLELGCRIHRIALLHRCSACGKSQRADRAELLFCQCGAKLAEQPLFAIDPAWMSIAPAFGLERRSNDEETFQPTPPREAVAASVVERLALYERQAAPDSRKVRVGFKLSLEDVQAAVAWFHDWPAQFEHRYRQALLAGRMVQNERRTCYIQSKSLSSPMFPAVNEVVRRVCSDSGLRPRTVMQKTLTDYLSIPDQSVPSAMKILGMSRAQVWWLAGNGSLPGSKQLSSNAMSIPTESVLDLLTVISATEDCDVAADRRGFRRSAMRQLLRTGLIPALVISEYSTSRVFPQVWDEFADYLLAVATPLPSELAASAVAIDAVIAASQRPTPDAGRTAHIVAAVARKDLPLYTRSPNPTRIDELLISIPQLKAVAQRHE